jgi:uncharacterized damage-inducible protein DinB
MTRGEVTRIVAAHDAVWEGWWPTLTAIPRSSGHRAIGGSFPSVFATTKHLVEAELYWQERLEHVPEEKSAPIPARSMAQIETAWRALRDRRRAWLAIADLRQPMPFIAGGGVPASVPNWQCVIHLVTHAHFHRGQLVSQCRAIGVTPPSLHLLGHFIGEFGNGGR